MWKLIEIMCILSGALAVVMVSLYITNGAFICLGFSFGVVVGWVLSPVARLKQEDISGALR